MRWLIGTGALLAGASLALGSLLLTSEREVELSFPQQRVWVSEDAGEDALNHLVTRLARRHGEVELHLRSGGKSLAVPAKGLGFAVDEHTTLQSLKQRLLQQRQAESWASKVLRRLRGKAWRVRVEPAVVLSEEFALAQLERLRGWVDVEPQDAQLRIAEHRIVPSRAGKRLSPGASVLRLKRLELGQDQVVELSVETLAPRVTESDLAPVDVTQVLASYETSFRGKAGPRAVNIRRAGKYLDGAILLPGEVLSFNERVGRRVHGRGFVDAPVIVNDELEQDVGGGVCQVATTLHAAARFGNLEVVARRSHSRPSGYAPLGLDATVLDGKVDLRLRNPYDEPLLVHVSFPSTYVIRVELLGRRSDVTVRHAAAVTHTEPFARRVWHRAEVPAGTFELKQKGSLGMDVVSVLQVEREGQVRTRRYRSKYYPVPEVFWVGQGARLVDLPPAPKDAVALVVDGEEVAPPGGQVRAEEGTATKTPDATDTPSLESPSDEVL